MMTMHLRTMSFTAAIAFATFGCGLEAIEGGDEEGGTGLPAEVQQAFDESCATSAGCHATGSALVVLQAPDSVAILEASAPAGGPYVTLGNLEESYIAQKILGGPNISGGTMPPTPQSDNDDRNKALIVGWIAGVPIEGEGEGGDGDGDAGGDGDGDPTGGMEQSCSIETVPDMPSFEADIYPVLEANCSCHVGGTPPAMPDAVGAYDNLVGVLATGSSLNYVEPGSADASYLWHKINGTQASAGMGGGGAMPPGDATLCGIEFQAIYAWIATGANL